MHRITRWDGTPEDPRADLPTLAEAFYQEGVSLANVEGILKHRMQRRVRRAIRAFTRLTKFNRQLAAYQAARRRGVRGADLIPYRPAAFAPDSKGRYAWARRELEREFRAAWPRNRRADGLQAAVLLIIQRAILGQLEAHNVRKVDRGLHTKTHRLATQFLRVHYPALCPDTTPDRLRRRRGLSRRPSN